MRALILSAGYGTRLGRLTKETPKPMIEIAGRPVLEHLVFHLYKFGITQIMVNLHYKPKVIMDYFQTRLLYSYEPKLLGEEGTIQSLKHWLINDYTVIMNGDTLTDIDIIQMFRWSGGKNIRSMESKIYTGTKIISPNYFIGDTSFTDYFDTDMYWQDIGTPSGLKKAKQYYEKESSYLS
jgi:NDP-sugar pyrophosphorylase family protein